MFVLQAGVDAPINDTAEQVYISSLALLKVKNSSLFDVMNFGSCLVFTFFVHLVMVS